MFGSIPRLVHGRSCLHCVMEVASCTTNRPGRTLMLKRVWRFVESFAWRWGLRSVGGWRHPCFVTVVKVEFDPHQVEVYKMICIQTAAVCHASDWQKHFRIFAGFLVWRWTLCFKQLFSQILPSSPIFSHNLCSPCSPGRPHQLSGNGHGLVIGLVP